MNENMILFLIMACSAVFIGAFIGYVRDISVALREISGFLGYLVGAYKDGKGTSDER